MGDVNKSDLVRACGYVSTKGCGERLNFTAFAKHFSRPSVNLGVGGAGGVGKGGRKLSYVAIARQRQPIIGVPALPVKPSDEFEIK